MSAILKTEKSLFQIKDMLLNNTTLRKLLYNMSPSSLEDAAPDIADVDPLITINPFVEDDNGVAESYKNAFIAIYPTEFVMGDNETTISLSIAAFVTKEFYELNNRKIRGLSIVDQIVRTLELKKLEFAGRLELLGVVSQTVDLGKFIGFTTNWEVVDGKVTNF